MNHIKSYSLQLEKLLFSSTSTKCKVIKQYVAGTVARGLLEPHAPNCVSLSSQYVSSKYCCFLGLVQHKMIFNLVRVPGVEMGPQYPWLLARGDQTGRRRIIAGVVRVPQNPRALDAGPVIIKCVNFCSILLM